MIVDRYTKAVLTVIAGCLLWQCLTTTVHPVAAESLAAQQSPAQQLAPLQSGVLATPIQPVVIVGWGEMTSQGRVTLNVKRSSNGVVSDPTLPVRLPYTDQNPLPITVPSHDPLPVEVRAAVRLAYTPDNPLPVGLTTIKKSTDAWDPIPTEVQRQPPTRLPGQ